MLRTVFALLCGLTATVIAITFVEAVGVKLYPPPPGLDYHDLAQMKAFIESMPLSAQALVVGAWLVGAFAGGAVGTLVDRGRHGWVALVPGAFVAVATISNATKLLHPMWMPAAGTVLAVPMAWLGWRIALRMVRVRREDPPAWRGYDR
jgi:hypothetical protein